MSLAINNISKQYGAKVLFQNATAQIGSRSHIALVGPNGSGKTTLLKIILGQEQPDSGMIVRAKQRLRFQNWNPNSGESADS